VRGNKNFREYGEAMAEAGIETKTARRKALGTVQVMEIGGGRRGGNGDARQRQVYRRRGMKGNDFQTLQAMFGKQRGKYGMHGEPKLHVPQRAA